MAPLISSNTFDDNFDGNSAPKRNFETDSDHRQFHSRFIRHAYYFLPVLVICVSFVLIVVGCACCSKKRRRSRNERRMDKSKSKSVPGMIGDETSMSSCSTMSTSPVPSPATSPGLLSLSNNSPSVVEKPKGYRLVRQSKPSSSKQRMTKDREKTKLDEQRSELKTAELIEKDESGKKMRGENSAKIALARSENSTGLDRYMKLDPAFLRSTTVSGGDSQKRPAVIPALLLREYPISADRVLNSPFYEQLGVGSSKTMSSYSLRTAGSYKSVPTPVSRSLRAAPDLSTSADKKSKDKKSHAKRTKKKRKTIGRRKIDAKHHHHHHSKDGSRKSVITKRKKKTKPATSTA